jgi:hypothetical protein
MTISNPGRLPPSPLRGARCDGEVGKKVQWTFLSTERLERKRKAQARRAGVGVAPFERNLYALADDPHPAPPAQGRGRHLPRKGEG